MRQLTNIQDALIKVLYKHLDNIRSITEKGRERYYNDLLGNTSAILAALLDILLNQEDDHDSTVWFDDSLLTSVKLAQNTVSISGIMIFGRTGTTEQWTGPFLFKIELKGDDDFSEYVFFFDDLRKREISYEKFRMNTNYWDDTEIDWRYIITKNGTT